MARRALLIGVSEYGEGFEALPGSLLDVQGMAEVLGNSVQGAFDELKTLENPERLEMEAATGQFFQNCAADDLLLFYFSGHGDLGVSIAQQQLHFCVKGSCKAGKRLQEWTAMPAETLKRQMSLSRSSQIVVILDCCYSGAIADLLRKGEAGGALDELRAPGRVILASSSASESSYQAVDGLSLYTHYLLEGMAGAALPQGRRQGQDWIVARDLHGYAERRFEVEQKGGVSPKIIVARDAGYEVPVVRAPRLEPVLEYRQAVDTLFQKLDQREGLRFDGEIQNPLARISLETLQQRLEKEGLSKDIAKQIEEQVQAPYKRRAEQRLAYFRAFETAVQDGLFPTNENRELLEDIRRNLLLGKSDAAQIEQLIDRERQLKPCPVVEVVQTAYYSSPDSYQSDTKKVNVSASHNSQSPSDEASAQTQQQANQSKWGTFEFQTVTLKVTTESSGFLGLGSKTNITQQRKSCRAEYFVEDLGDGVALEMVRIPSGDFLMGAAKGEEGASDDEYPQHRVMVPEFCLGKFAVTQAQYQAVMGKNPSNFKGDKRPVERVSWNNAQEFCQKLSDRLGGEYRLPSEAEWEYACRAGTTTPFHFGKTISTELANYRLQHWEDEGTTYPGKYGAGQLGSFREETTEVGSFPPNAFGLYDMHGNVWEWCLDRWHDNYDDFPSDFFAWTTTRDKEKLYILRGGSWYGHPGFCRSANRNYFSPGNRDNTFGFRVAYVISPARF